MASSVSGAAALVSVGRAIGRCSVSAMAILALCSRSSDTASSRSGGMADDNKPCSGHSRSSTLAYLLLQHSRSGAGRGLPYPRWRRMASPLRRMRGLHEMAEVRRRGEAAIDTTKITVTSGSSQSFTVGMWVEFADTRRWWVKLWHWIIGKKVQLRFEVVEPITSTSFTIR